MDLSQYGAAGGPPFLLVRVQDDMHGAFISDVGLVLKYDRQDEAGQRRNTMHWSVNSMVADHPYGRFNLNADGSLKGKVVVIAADADELPVPAGLGQVDTWFRLTSQDGERGLPVGKKAIVVAPEGMAVPEGANVVRYAGGVAERDAAVKEVFDQHQVQIQTAGMREWVGGANEAAWQEVLHYWAGRSDRPIHTGPHDGSVDAQIENVGTAWALDAMQREGERLYQTSSGMQLPIVEVLQQRVADGTQAVALLKQSVDETEWDRIGAYYVGRMATWEKAIEIASRLDHSILNAQIASQHGSSFPPPLPTDVASPPPLPSVDAAKDVPDGATLVLKGLHIGQIVDIQNGYAIQHSGRDDFVAHDLKKFDKVPDVGSVLEISYRSDRVSVQSRADAQHTNTFER